MKKKKKLLPCKTQDLIVQTSAKKIPFFIYFLFFLFLNLQFLNLISVTFKFFYEKKNLLPRKTLSTKQDHTLSTLTLVFKLKLLFFQFSNSLKLLSPTSLLQISLQTTADRFEVSSLTFFFGRKIFQFSILISFDLSCSLCVYFELMFG